MGNHELNNRLIKFDKKESDMCNNINIASEKMDILRDDIEACENIVYNIPDERVKIWNASLKNLRLRGASTKEIEVIQNDFYLTGMKFNELMTKWNALSDDYGVYCIKSDNTSRKINQNLHLSAPATFMLNGIESEFKKFNTKFLSFSVEFKIYRQEMDALIIKLDEFKIK